jgi:Putative MetA-pathway of phenol degradation
MRNVTVAVVLAAATTFSDPGTVLAADHTSLQLTGGVDFSSGDYGASENTDITFVPIGIKYEINNFRVFGTLPYLSIKGPGAVVGGADPIIVGPEGPVTTESGLGDIILGMAYLVEPTSDNMPFIEFAAKVKLPTADESRGLGTGKTDLALQIDAFQSFGNVTPYATLGYRIRGSSDLISLKNSFYGSAGFSYKLSPDNSAGVSFDFQTKSSDFLQNRYEVIPFFSFKASPDWKLLFYGSAGFSDSVPNFGLGVQIKYTAW